RLGLGLSELAVGDLDGARAEYGRAVAEGGSQVPLARLMKGLADGAAGDETAAAALASLAAEQAPLNPSLAAGARLAEAYAYYWTGRYDQAAKAFQAAAAAAETPDARAGALYGLGQTRRRLGDLDGAAAAFREASEHGRAAGRSRVGRALRDLDARAVLRSSVTRYRRS